MAQVTFTGSSGTIPNLNQNFTQLYDLREVISTPGYNAAIGTVKVKILDNSFGFRTATPSTWVSTSIGLQIGNFCSISNAANGAFDAGFNYYESAAGVFTYLITDEASRYRATTDGGHEWYTAPSGTAGTPITFTRVGRLDAAGFRLYSGTLGYATGSGGAVTQLTSKSTGVTLNKSNGQITMNGASLAAAAAVSFTLTNSMIAATDVVNASIASAATAGAYTLQVDAVAAGSCRFSLRNHSGGPLSEAVVINFALIEAVTA